MTDNARTASSVILGAFRENSDRIAIRRSSSFPEMTYGELLECACRVAAFLEDKGIESGKGNRVAIYMNRNPGYVVSFIGCLIFGYAAVLIDAEYPESRRDYIIRHSAAKYILDEDGYCQAMECEPVQPDTVAGTMITIPLENGENRIELKYHIPYLQEGMYISAAAFAVLLIDCLRRALRRRKNAR